jgi:hypothetical protein
LARVGQVELDGGGTLRAAEGGIANVNKRKGVAIRCSGNALISNVRAITMISLRIRIILVEEIEGLTI